MVKSDLYRFIDYEYLLKIFLVQISQRKPHPKSDARSTRTIGLTPARRIERRAQRRGLKRPPPQVFEATTRR